MPNDNVSVSLDMTEFREAVRQYIPLFHKDAKDVMNQSLFDFLNEAFKQILPFDPGTARNRIRGYLWQQYSQTIIKAKSGKNAGKFVARTRRIVKGAPRQVIDKHTGAVKIVNRKGLKQFCRIHMLVQKRNKKDGNKGLYGETMIAATKKFAKRNIAGIGFIKSIMVAPILELAKIVQYKAGKPPTHHFSKWGASQGSASLEAARGSAFTNPTAQVYFGWNFSGKYASRAIGMINNAFAYALSLKTGKLERQIERKMQQRADQFNGHK